jgi:hypothetical protein
MAVRTKCRSTQHAILHTSCFLLSTSLPVLRIRRLVPFWSPFDHPELLLPRSAPADCHWFSSIPASSYCSVFSCTKQSAKNIFIQEFTNLLPLSLLNYRNPNRYGYTDNLRVGYLPYHPQRPSVLKPVPVGACQPESLLYPLNMPHKSCTDGLRALARGKCLLCRPLRYLPHLTALLRHSPPHLGIPRWHVLWYCARDSRL